MKVNHIPLTVGESLLFKPKRLTLLWYPEWFCVSWQNLMHDSPELIQHLQALLLPHTGVVETRESWLERQSNVSNKLTHLSASWRHHFTHKVYIQAMMPSPTHNWEIHYTVAGNHCCRCPSLVHTFVASVRMSFESFTRHCSGTVTSMTFALSCLLLLSVTNFPYQALRMMRPI